MPLRLAQRTTVLDAMMSRRRNVRSPMRDVRPRRSFPPVERWIGVRPIQAAKPRPDGNVSADGASASRAVAISGPTTGTLIRRWAVSSDLALAEISASSSLNGSCKRRNASTRMERQERVASGTLDVESSIWAMTIFRQVSADRIDQLGALAHKDSGDLLSSGRGCAETAPNEARSIYPMLK